VVRTLAIPPPSLHLTWFSVIFSQQNPKVFTGRVPCRVACKNAVLKGADGFSEVFGSFQSAFSEAFLYFLRLWDGWTVTWRPP
jgi:hypothetical protein